MKSATARTEAWERIDWSQPSVEMRRIQYEGRWDEWLPPEVSTVVDVGCGDGNMCPVFTDEPALDYTGVDLSSNRIARARERWGERAEFLEGDVYDLPFADDDFDLAFCQEVLHHLPAEGDTPVALSAVKELRRVARFAMVNQRCAIGERTERPGGVVVRRYERVTEVDAEMRGLGATQRWVVSAHRNWTLRCEVVDALWLFGPD
jgi:ubiquinone/menaquinone biosynthesis C-methylase UbiE